MSGGNPTGFRPSRACDGQKQKPSCPIGEETCYDIAYQEIKTEVSRLSVWFPSLGAEGIATRPADAGLEHDHELDFRRWLAAWVYTDHDSFRFIHNGSGRPPVPLCRC